MRRDSERASHGLDPKTKVYTDKVAKQDDSSGGNSLLKDFDHLAIENKRYRLICNITNLEVLSILALKLDHAITHAHLHTFSQ